MRTVLKKCCLTNSRSVLVSSQNILVVWFNAIKFPVEASFCVEIAIHEIFTHLFFNLLFVYLSIVCVCFVVSFYCTDISASNGRSAS